MAIRIPLLTKSKYMNGLQCHKLLWYQCHEPTLMPPTDASTQVLYDQGHEINKWAQRLYPDGVLIDWDRGFNPALGQTQQAIRDRRTIFEAGLLSNHLFARVDILKPAAGDAWDLIEVKSSTSVKEEQLQDVAFQKYVAGDLKLNINRCHLMLVDNTYVRRGKIDPSALLKTVDVTKEADRNLPAVLNQLRAMRTALARDKNPDVPIGAHCNEPYLCPLKKMCWAGIPERNVFTLKAAGSLGEELMKAGIISIKDIPEGIELTAQQRIQVDCEKTGGPHVDPEGIREFLSRLVYPVYILDFETVSPAIPAYDLSKPYQQVPFQYSLHIIEKLDGPKRHLGYLHSGKADPRPKILKRLQRELGTAGSIAAYNSKFEIMVLNDATQFYPEYRSWFDGIVPRFVDLYQPFKVFHYYHPSQNGSASLKAVMPALIGTSYSGLAIGAGALASQEFFRITFKDVDPEECSKVRAALETYCKQDTEGLIYILQALNQLSLGGTPLSLK